MINAEGPSCARRLNGKQRRDSLTMQSVSGLQQEASPSANSVLALYCKTHSIAACSRNMLQWIVVQSNHEPLVSRELFLRANGLLEANNHGYTVKGENEHLPLKCFLRCEKCGQHLHGYIVKKKGIHYYRCSMKGCNTNRNAHVLNGLQSYWNGSAWTSRPMSYTSLSNR